MKTLFIDKIPELPFYVTEALNQLRINLGFSGANIKVIMITSSTPNEGKSFVAMNLWKQMASLGSRCLFIDCDLRNSVLRDKWGFRTEDEFVGIVHYLAGKAELNDVVYLTNVENGYIIPVSTDVADPTILLEGQRFDDMMKVCREEFDYIIVDTPPLGSVADALNIAGHCDGSLLVIRSGEVPRKMVENSVQLLRRTSIPLLGVVLNRAETGHGAGSYYYNHYYRYGYGEDYYGSDNKKDKGKKKPRKK